MRLTQGIHRAVQLYGNRPALVGDRFATTWREFADRVARLAAQGSEEARLAGDLLARVEDYLRSLGAEASEDDAGDVDDLY